MAGTVLYLPGGLESISSVVGLGFNAKKFLGGELGAGRKLLQVNPYKSSSFTNEAAHQNMMNLDAMLHDYPGTAAVPTRVFGHSLGSQIIYKWMREKGPTSDLDPDTIEFYAAGCPEQRYTGASTLYPDESPAKYPGDPAHGGETWSEESPTPPEFYGGWGVGYGLPATIPWKLWCIAAQYDGWADAPNDPDNDQVKRVTKWFFIFPLQKMWDHSLTCLMKSSSGPHSSYDSDDSIPLSDSDRNFVYQDPVNPTVKYVWQQTYPLPSLNNLAWITFLARALDIDWRPELEEAYTHRPVSIDDPNEWDNASAGWFS